MIIPKFFDMLDHDIAAHIRNIETVENLLTEKDSDIPTAIRLIRASVSELLRLRRRIAETDLNEIEFKRGSDAHNDEKENYEKISK